MNKLPCATRGIIDFLLLIGANDLVLIVNTEVFEILVLVCVNSPIHHVRTISRAYTWTILTRNRNIIIF